MATTSKHTKILVSVIVMIIVSVTLIALLVSISRPSINNSKAASCSETDISEYCVDEDTQALCRGGTLITNDCMFGYSCNGGVCQKVTSGQLPGNE